LFILSRKQIIKYGNYYLSEHIYVTSGVPQEDHLSAILFSLFINHIPKVVSFSKIILFADDEKYLRKSEA